MTSVNLEFLQNLLKDEYPDVTIHDFEVNTFEMAKYFFGFLAFYKVGIVCRYKYATVNIAFTSNEIIPTRGDEMCNFIFSSLWC